MEEKLRRLMKHEGINSTRLAEILGIQASGISHIMSGRNKPSYDFLLKLLQRFPQISPDWLMLDKGPMYRDEIKKTPANPVRGAGVTDASDGGGSAASTGASDLFGGSASREASVGSVDDNARKTTVQANLASVQQPQGQSGSVGSDDDDIIPVSTHPSNSRSIVSQNADTERIVVFYHDKTFAEYFPQT